MVNVFFGTDGWRGEIASEFTVDNLRSVVQAIMSHVADKAREPRLVIGYDTRFMSDYYARVAAEVACGNGATVMMSERPVTTPLLSFSVNALGASGGIMVTASHNPYQYNGIKFKEPYGGSALASTMRDIEARVGRGPVSSMPFARAREKGTVTEADFFRPYRDQLLGFLDVDAIRKGRAKSALDCMHGTSCYYARGLWEALGLELKLIRPLRDPLFGGGRPEPLKENLGELMRQVQSLGLKAGFATDGDADRLGGVDALGRYIGPHEWMGLLLLHMKKNRGQTGIVVKTAPASSLIDRIASGLGLQVRETPVGFKHVCELMLKEDVLIGGEENGGVGVKGHVPERDGLLNALLLLEMMAVEGKGLRELLDQMDKKYGRLYHKRYDGRIPADRGEGLVEDIKARVASVYGSYRVREVSTLDGVKAVMDDGSWVLFRRSGTEPLLRIYAESEEEAKTDRLIKAGLEAFLG